ncbi:hypothetical protein Ancab_029587 [Ancistrocladus abbreviatus]
MAAGLFRVIGGTCRTMIVTHSGGAIALLLKFLTGGFIIPHGKIPKWWKWAHWFSPLTYAFNALATNEMISPRWMNKMASDNATHLGVSVLLLFDVEAESYWNPQAIISAKEESTAEHNHQENEANQVDKESKLYGEDDMGDPRTARISIQTANYNAQKRGMILPFYPLSMSFDSLNYYVDIPLVRI